MRVVINLNFSTLSIVHAIWKTLFFEIAPVLECEDTLYVVREPNFENCLDFISVAPLFEKVIFVSDQNDLTSAIRKFMLDMPTSGSFQNKSL